MSEEVREDAEQCREWESVCVRVVNRSRDKKQTLEKRWSLLETRTD